MLIKLTKQSTGEPIWVNANLIECAQPNGSHTRLEMSSGLTYGIREAPEQIASLAAPHLEHRVRL